MFISELQMTSEDTKNCQQGALGLQGVGKQSIKKSSQNLTSNLLLSLI